MQKDFPQPPHCSTHSFLGRIFADPASFAGLVGPWLAIAGSREEAFSVIPSEPKAWERMQQLLNELLIALASFDCRRSVGLLCEAVAEYRQTHDIRDFVWAQKTFSISDQDREPEDAHKVTDFIAKRRLVEGGKGPAERGS